MPSWVTVWGYGADISASKDALFVREKGKAVPVRYPFSSISHLLIAGDNILHTAAIRQCAEHHIPISFFDIRGRPAAAVQPGYAAHTAVQDTVSGHAYAKAMIEASIESRMRYLHELSEKHPSLYLKGEFEIIAGARSELEYLITLPELARVFTLTKMMYYEILSRVIPSALGYRRRTEDEVPDPVNALFSTGYAALYATVQVACIGAGLDLAKSSIFGQIIPCSGSPCVREIMDPAMVPMVDRCVVATAQDPRMAQAVKEGSRWILPPDLMAEFSRRLAQTVDADSIAANVDRYAAAVRDGRPPQYHYPA